MNHIWKMYAIMCAAASEALDVLPNTTENIHGRKILQHALGKAENLYIQDGEVLPLCRPFERNEDEIRE